MCPAWRLHRRCVTESRNPHRRYPYWHSDAIRVGRHLWPPNRSATSPLISLHPEEVSCGRDSFAERTARRSSPFQAGCRGPPESGLERQVRWQTSKPNRDRTTLGPSQASVIRGVNRRAAIPLVRGEQPTRRQTNDRRCVDRSGQRIGRLEQDDMILGQWFNGASSGRSHRFCIRFGPGRFEIL